MSLFEGVNFPLLTPDVTWCEKIFQLFPPRIASTGFVTSPELKRVEDDGVIIRVGEEASAETCVNISVRFLRRRRAQVNNKVDVIVSSGIMI